MLLFLLVASAISLPIASPQNSPCPNDYHYFEETNRCYKFYTQPQLFPDAQRVCLSDGASMVSIHSLNENNFLGAWIWEATYIGMRSRNDDEQNFQWVDGTPVDFTAWGVGYPNNYRDSKQTNAVHKPNFLVYKEISRDIRAPRFIGTHLTTELCGRFTFAIPFLLSFAKSRLIFRILSNLVPLLIMPSSDPPTAATDYWDAVTECSRTGGSLASIHSQAEEDFVSDLLRSVGYPTSFIGLWRDVIGDFRWDDDTPVDFPPVWGPGQPALQPEENCVMMTGTSQKTPADSRIWYNYFCDSAPFICARPSAVTSSGMATNDKSKHWIAAVAVVVPVLLLLLLGLLVVVVFIGRRRRQQAVSAALALSKPNELKAVNDESTEALYSDIQALGVANFDSRFLIPFVRIGLVERVLGTGNFGMVYRSNYQKTKNECLKVACKQLHSIDSEEKRVDFLIEAAIMMSLRHRNVVGIHGVAFNDEKVPILVMELMGGGSLYCYLRSNATSESEKLRFGKELASGMLYLHSCNLLHRDLATRNCMYQISSSLQKTLRLTSDDLTLKISDFGLAREFHETYEFQHARPMPYRWTAPEAFELHSMTAKSDIWSYGIVLWEIFSRAELPYKGIENMRDYLIFVQNYGSYYSVMVRCWEAEPRDRPDFGAIYVEISTRHQKILELQEAPIYVDDATPVDPEHLLEGLKNTKHGEGEYESLSAMNAVYAPVIAILAVDPPDYLIPESRNTAKNHVEQE